MIAQIDILSQIAKFTTFADNLVKVSTDAYRMHPHLYGIRTTEMFTTVPELLITLPDPETALEAASIHQIPEILADFILTKDDDVKNHEEIIVGLARNKNWRDNVRPIAVRLLAFALYNEDIDEEMFQDVDLMKKACKYDIVIREYSKCSFAKFDGIKGYFYGRSQKKMTELVSMHSTGFKELSKLCDDLSSFSTFIDYIHETKSKSAVKFVLKSTIMPTEWREIFSEKY